MDETPNSKSSPGNQYDTNFNNFQSSLYAQVRREAFGEDIGQNSWMTAAEQDRFIKWLNLAPGKRLLDVACGSGGPALRIAAATGASVVGVDIHQGAIAAGNALATERGMSKVAEFRVVDAAQRLPFPDHTFDAVTCIDALNHLPGRPGVIADWARLLKPQGRLLFTDATIVTGPLTNQEIAVRSSSSLYVFVPAGYDEQVLIESSLRIVVAENVTKNTAEIAERRRLARESHADALRKVEGNEAFASQQEFLTVASRLAQEGRLSRFVLVAEKPN